MLAIHESISASEHLYQGLFSKHLETMPGSDTKPNTYFACSNTFAMAHLPRLLIFPHNPVTIIFSQGRKGWFKSFNCGCNQWWQGSNCSPLQKIKPGLAFCQESIPDNQMFQTTVMDPSTWTCCAKMPTTAYIPFGNSIPAVVARTSIGHCHWDIFQPTCFAEKLWPCLFCFNPPSRHGWLLRWCRMGRRSSLFGWRLHWLLHVHVIFDLLMFLDELLCLCILICCSFAGENWLFRHIATFSVIERWLPKITAAMTLTITVTRTSMFIGKFRSLMFWIERLGTIWRLPPALALALLCCSFLFFPGFPGFLLDVEIEAGFGMRLPNLLLCCWVELEFFDLFW